MTKFWTGLNSKRLADDKINMTEKTKICSGKGRKYCWEKEKMLFTSIFSFFHKVFQTVLQGRSKSGLCGKGL